MGTPSAGIRKKLIGEEDVVLTERAADTVVNQERADAVARGEPLATSYVVEGAVDAGAARYWRILQWRSQLRTSCYSCFPVVLAFADSPDASGWVFRPGRCRT